MKITHPRRSITNQRPCPARPHRQWSWPGRLTHLPIAGGVGVEQCVPQTGRRISAISRPEQGTKGSSLIQSLRHRRRRLKRQSLNLPRPPRPRAPEKSLNYLSEISDAEQSLEPQPQASPPPVAQTNVVPVLDGAEIRTGRFWDLSRPLQHLFEAVDEIRRTIGLVHDHIQADERREPPPTEEHNEGGHNQDAPQQDPEWTRDPPHSRRAGLDGTAPPTVREGDVYRADCAVASRADAHFHPSPPDQARGSLPAPPELEILNPSAWPKPNWEPKGTSLGTPVDYWPPRWSPTQWSGRPAGPRRSPAPTPTPIPAQLSELQGSTASGYDPLPVEQDWEYLLEHLHGPRVLQPADV